MAPLYVLIPAALVLSAIFFLIVRKLGRVAPDLEHETVWLGRFSVAKYRPMKRLLSREDFDFLKRQQGYAPAVLRRLSVRRRAVFRAYLRNLRRDFNRLQRLGWLVAMHSNVDRPDLVGALLRLRLAFFMALIAVEAQLLLHALGVGTVSAGALVSTLDGLRGRLAPVTA